MENKQNLITKEGSSNEEEINLNLVFNLISRNRYLIVFLTSISTIIAIIYSLRTTSIYKGRFQIIVKAENNNDSLISTKNILLNGGNSSSSNKTEEFILKSPSVLKPVYKFVKKNYQKRGESIDNLSYSKWSKNTLDIKFEKGTSVLNVEFKDKDKLLIIETLNLIKSRYQNYSKSTLEKNLKKSVNFLTKQEKILKKKSNISMKKFNEFSIKNGLGDIDGFVTLGNQYYSPMNTTINNYDSSSNYDSSRLNYIQNRNNSNFSNQENIQSNNAGQRFKNQFALLEQYEARYIDLSAKLKPESKVLTDLNSKIENLRNALKRPNEILLEYRELSTIAQRNANILNAIQDELVMTNIEMAKQKDPWQSISEPTLDDGRVSPKRKRIAIATFLLSFIGSTFVAFFKEKQSGYLFELEDIKTIINSPYLETIYLKNLNLSKKLFLNTISKKINLNTKGQEEIIVIDLFNAKNNNQDLEDLFEENNIFKFSNIEKELIQENKSKVIFLVHKGKSKTKDIFLINEYIKLLNNNNVGWFCIDYNTKF